MRIEKHESSMNRKQGYEHRVERAISKIKLIGAISHLFNLLILSFYWIYSIRIECILYIYHLESNSSILYLLGEKKKLI